MYILGDEGGEEVVLMSASVMNRLFGMVAGFGYAMLPVPSDMICLQPHD